MAIHHIWAMSPAGTLYIGQKAQFSIRNQHAMLTRSLEEAFSMKLRGLGLDSARIH
jgi:hypothetical protein